MFRVKQVGNEKKFLTMKKEGGHGNAVLDQVYLNEVKSFSNHLHQNYQTSPYNLPVSLSPVSSSCSLLSVGNGFCCNSSEDGTSSSSPSFTPFGAEYDPSLYNHALLFKNPNADSHELVDNFLAGSFYDKMHIGDEKDASDSVFGFGDCFSSGSYNPVDNSCLDNVFDKGLYDFGGLSQTKSFDDDMALKLIDLQKGIPSRSRSMFSDPIYPHEELSYLGEARNEQMSNHSLGEGFYSSMSQQCGNDSSHLNVMRGRMVGFTESPTLNPSCKGSLSLPSSTEKLEGFDFEESFIIQGNSLNYGVDKGLNRSKGRKKREKKSKPVNGFSLGGVCENDLKLRSFNPLLVEATYSSLAEVQGYIYCLAKDQCGCRFLQRIFEEGSIRDVQRIFTETINHIVELMMDQFGNYFVQKLLEVCSEEQRMQIVAAVTELPGVLIVLCLNTHGTRAVQKLIETLKTRQQIALVIHALEPGFLDLIKDVNGNHVVQRCLQCLSKDHNKFIFNAAAKFCADIATHQHGCCVLNRCIAHSTGEDREKLVTEISAKGFVLAQDPFANYVVQYIIELKIPSAATTLISQFEGNYVYLSKQKFSSHVVEKCLKHLEQSRSRIIREFLSVSHFDQLLQDPYANYVIQSALEVTKGPLHSALVEAVQPHMMLRSSPYCKKIFTRNLLKK